MRLLFDTNIIMDIALKRIPYYNDSVAIFQKINNTSVYGFITATTITDIYYIAKKSKGYKIAIEFIDNLVQILELIGIDKEIVIEALKNKQSDFEDSIQSIASYNHGLDFIITRNVKDFKKSPVPALTPSEYLKTLKS